MNLFNSINAIKYGCYSSLFYKFRSNCLFFCLILRSKHP